MSRKPRTLGELAKERGESVDDLFVHLYLDPQHYRCTKCGNETSGSYSLCPECGAQYSYEPLWGTKPHKEGA